MYILVLLPLAFELLIELFFKITLILGRHDDLTAGDSLDKLGLELEPIGRPIPHPDHIHEVVANV